MADPIEKLMSDAQDYWNRDDAWTQKISHWRGSPRTPDARWDKFGQQHWGKFLALVAAVKGHSGDFRSMMEWGCGGGANVAAFTRHFTHVYGIDISKSNLEECDRQMRRLGRAERFWPYPITCDQPHAVVQKIHADALPRRSEEEHYPHIGGEVDFVLSTACFQHFPSKEYGARILQLLHMALRAGGLALIQIREDDGGSYYASKDRDYCGGNDRNAIRFTSYRVEEFMDMAGKIGFRDVGLLDRGGKANYCFFYLEKPGG